MSRISNKKQVGIGTLSATILALCATPLAADTDSVTLKSADGAVVVSGRLVDVTADNYVIDTEIGVVTVRRELGSCHGDGCPTKLDTPIKRNDPSLASDMFIFGSEAVGELVMPLLLSGYATSLDGAVEGALSEDFGAYQAALIGQEGFGDTLATVTVVSSTSADAFANLLGGFADLGMSSRRILRREASQLKDAGAGDMQSPQNEHFLAVDSVVVVAHPENPVSELTTEQFKAILKGEIVNWSQLGGNDSPIKVIQAPAGDSTRAFVEATFLSDDDIVAPATVETVAGDAAISNAIYSDPSAIGYVSYAFQQGAKPLDLVSACGIQHRPDEFSAKTGEYPLQRFLYMYSREDRMASTTADFLRFATSPAAEPLIEKSGYIGLGVSPRDLSADADRTRQLSAALPGTFEGKLMGEMLATMEGYERLSTTFRFKTGSKELDARGRLNLSRLTDYLEGMPSGTEVAFVGFTDEVGAFSYNLELGKQRAAQVRSALKQLSGTRIDNIQTSTLGFGEIAPVACNAEETGRAVNRRVEIWVKKSAES